MFFARFDNHIGQRGGGPDDQGAVGKAEAALHSGARCGGVGDGPAAASPRRARERHQPPELSPGMDHTILALDPDGHVVRFTPALRFRCSTCGGAGALDELDVFWTYDEKTADGSS